MLGWQFKAPAFDYSVVFVLYADEELNVDAVGHVDHAGDSKTKALPSG